MGNTNRLTFLVLLYHVKQLLMVIGLLFQKNKLEKILIDIIYHVSALVICQIYITRVSQKLEFFMNERRYMINYHYTKIYMVKALFVHFLDISV